MSHPRSGASRRPCPEPCVRHAMHHLWTGGRGRARDSPFLPSFLPPEVKGASGKRLAKSGFPSTSLSSVPCRRRRRRRRRSSLLACSKTRDWMHNVSSLPASRSHRRFLLRLFSRARARPLIILASADKAKLIECGAAAIGEVYFGRLMEQQTDRH